MYTSFFGLNEKPFSITPNPRYLYMSERHTEALAHLIYGIKDGGGFVQLTGEVGTGKTTLIRSLLQRMPKNADVALILNPRLSAPEFLAAILEELHIPLPAQRDSVKALTDALNAFLLKNYSAGRRTILIVDEAQNFAVDVLEQIRLLTNLETSQHKLLQITLIGQPELRAMLARNDLRQLAQRITGRYHLEPLSQSETIEYLQHRMRVAGATRALFTPAAARELYRLSGGVPRIINVIADRALLGAFTREQAQVAPAMVRRAAAEVYDSEQHRGRLRSWLPMAAAIGMGALLIAAAILTAMQLGGPRPGLPASANAGIAEPNAAGALPEPDPASITAVAAPRPLAELLQVHSDLTDTRSAFAALFATWGVAFDNDDQPACAQAENYQLACLFERGSLAQLQRLDRPAILTLQDAAGTRHQVVLTVLTSDTATLNLGPNRYKVELAELNELWFGDFLLLWRPQLTPQRALVRGMQDPEVTWLRTSLATIQGRPLEPMDSELFDEELEARVRDYQIERRLTVDGMVGQQTQIAMNSDLAIDAPRLTRLN